MRKNSRFIIFLCAILVVFLCSGCVTNEADGQGPKETVQRFFDAVKSGDIDGAIECFTPAFQQQFSAALSLGGLLSNFVAGVDGSSLLGGIMSIANQSSYKDCKFIADSVEYTDEEHATVHVTVEGAGGGIPSEATIKTVKYSGKWYMEL